MGEALAEPADDVDGEHAVGDRFAQFDEGVRQGLHASAIVGDGEGALTQGAELRVDEKDAGLAIPDELLLEGGPGGVGGRGRSGDDLEEVSGDGPVDPREDVEIHPNPMGNVGEGGVAQDVVGERILAEGKKQQAAPLVEGRYVEVEDDRVPLPELENHRVLDSPDGLLLLHRNRDNAVRLLHPFTRDIAEFPDINCLAHQLHDLEYGEYNFNSWLHYIPRYLNEALTLCAAVNVASTGAVTLMLALHSIGRVAFASAGDDVWTISNWKMKQLDKALLHQGKLYVVSCEDGLTHVFMIEPPQPQSVPCREGEESSSVPALPLPKTIATCSSEEIHLPSLVEMDSEIMLVGYSDKSFSRILVLKLGDLVLGRTVPVKSIGDHVLFAGARSLCVSSGWLPSIGGNSVVCHRAGEKYLVQYDLSSGTWSQASDGHLMLTPLPRPCTLIHHIFTCCYREFWNIGFLFCFKIELKGVLRRL